MNNLRRTFCRWSRSKTETQSHTGNPSYLTFDDANRFSGWTLNIRGLRSGPSDRGSRAVSDSLLPNMQWRYDGTLAHDSH